jgi:hypothetical protein
VVILAFYLVALKWPAFVQFCRTGNNVTGAENR